MTWFDIIKGTYSWGGKKDKKDYCCLLAKDMLLKTRAANPDKLRYWVYKWDCEEFRAWLEKGGWPHPESKYDDILKAWDDCIQRGTKWRDWDSG